MYPKATKAGKSLCIRTGRTIGDNGLHKHYLKPFTWHWRDGRRLTIAAKPAHCAEVKRSLMNRKPYLRGLTVTVQQPHCALATNPVGLYIRRNDEKVTRKDTEGPWTLRADNNGGTQAVPTFTQKLHVYMHRTSTALMPQYKSPPGQMELWSACRSVYRQSLQFQRSVCCKICHKF